MMSARNIIFTLFFTLILISATAQKDPADRIGPLLYSHRFPEAFQILDTLSSIRHDKLEEWYYGLHQSAIDRYDSRPPDENEWDAIRRLTGFAEAYDTCFPLTWACRKAEMSAARATMSYAGTRDASDAPPESDIPYPLQASYRMRALCEKEFRTFMLSEKNMLAREKMARIWVEVTDFFREEMIRRTDSQNEIAAIGKSVCDLLRPAFLACVELQDAESYSAYNFVSSVVQGCDLYPEKWKAALQDAHFAHAAGWRFLAAHPLFSAEAPELWSRAIGADADVRMQVADRLALAGVWEIKTEFEKAWEELTQASRCAPDLGTPWMRKADLLRNNSAICGFSSFEKKALNWEAYTLLDMARGKKGVSEEELNRKLYACRSGFPDWSELQSYGLQPGDTWPLGCWMQMVTTVKSP